MKNSEVKIRPARKKDWPDILRILEERAEKLETRKEHLPRWNQFYVATSKGKVVGCCALSLTVEIRSLAMASSYEGNGVGTRLTKACEARALRQRVRQVVLITDKETVPFFQRLGYGYSKGNRVAMVKDMAKSKSKKRVK